MRARAALVDEPEREACHGCPRHTKCERGQRADEERRYRAGDDGRQREVHEALQRRSHAAHRREEVEHQQRGRGHDEGRSDAEDEDRQHVPHDAGWQRPAREEIERDAGEDQRVASAHGSLRRAAPGEATRQDRAQHDPADHRDEQPGEAPRRHAEKVDQEGGRAGDVDEEAGEVERQHRREQREVEGPENGPVVAPQRPRVQRLTRRARKRLGQTQRRPDEHGGDEGEQHPEDRAPAEDVEHHAAQDRRDRRRDPEHERHLRHEPLGFRTLEAVPYDRAAHDQACAGRQPLQHAEQPQRFDVARDGAAERRERVHDETAQHHGPAPECVGQRAVPEHHPRSCYWRANVRSIAADPN